MLSDLFFTLLKINVMATIVAAIVLTVFNIFDNPISTENKIVSNPNIQVNIANNTNYLNNIGWYIT